MLQIEKKLILLFSYCTNSMSCKITALSHYLPNNILTNQDLESLFPGWDGTRSEKKIGITQRHIADDHETALDMGVKVCEKLFQKFDKEKVDFILFCTQSPDYFLPTSACIMQDRLGLRNDIGALDFNLGCSGFVYGLSLAKGLISSDAAKTVLLVTSETYSKHLHPKDRANRSIFGDGASACIVESSEENGVLQFVFGTDGSGYDHLIVQNGGFRNAYDENVEDITDEFDNVNNANCLQMKGSDIFNFTIAEIPKMVQKTLEKNSMTMEDVDFFIFHQANAYMLKFLQKMTKIPKDKFYIYMEDKGNTVSATIPIALEECLAQNLIKSGDHVLIAGFGVGLSMASTILKI